MSQCLKKIKYWSQICLIPVYWLSFIVPRNKKLWVVGSTFGNRYADNGRYFYLYMCQHRNKDVRTVWITRKKEIAAFLQSNGYEAYYVRSLKGIWCCLRAKVYVYDNYTKDICYWTSGGAVHINLWHGSGNKKTNYDNKFDYLRHPRNRKEKWSNYLISMTNEKPQDYVIATSPMMQEIFMSAFRLEKEHVLINGYPRNDMTTGTMIHNINTQKEQNVLEQMQKHKEAGKRILVYMPTFRASETMFFDVMDLDGFNEFLQKQNLVFYTKMHPKSKVKVLFEKISYSNIVNVDADVDPYTFLREVDLLVTDYSSIYSDYLLLDRPSVLFPYDFEEYSKDTRECYFTYEEYMPEIKAYTMQELMDAIVKVLESDEGAVGRKQLRDKIFETEDGRSCERLYHRIQEILGKQ